ncbi:MULTISPECIES: hypothetical protein [Actinomadura]|uniref:Uncharacterized protein n=2 Tax=Actinomadura TaxID=1988 RepID=A0A7D3ZSF2_ACTVE|nr:MULTISPECIES: hypothetical protein [Actinomadura]MBO2456430.1 hypothetical protein [Actinomadura violacea]QKG25482.1 hypothetical protein ACTIVE_7134 [Actinomadura verrucosospora]
MGDLNDKVDRRTAEPERRNEPGEPRTARTGEAADDAGRAGDKPRKVKPGDAARKMRAMFKG